MTEPEDFTKEFSVHSQEFALVDASVLDTCQSPLAKKAIRVPLKHADVILSVTAEYDDTILRNLTIKPAQSDVDPKEIKTKAHKPNKEIGKGLEPGEEDDTTQHLVGEKREAGNIPTTKRGKDQSSTHKSLRKHSSWAERNKMRGNMEYPGRTRQPHNRGGGTANAPSKRQKSRQGKRLHKGKKQRSSSLADLVLNLMKTGKAVTPEDLQKVEDKDILLESLNMLLAMTMNGWEVKGNIITNGNHVLRESDWDVEEGFIVGCENLSFDFDWIYDTRRTLDKVIVEEREKNVAMLLESVDGR